MTVAGGGLCDEDTVSFSAPRPSAVSGVERISESINEGRGDGVLGQKDVSAEAGLSVDGSPVCGRRSVGGSVGEPSSFVSAGRAFCPPPMTSGKEHPLDP